MSDVVEQPKETEVPNPETSVESKAQFKAKLDQLYAERNEMQKKLAALDAEKLEQERKAMADNNQHRELAASYKAQLDSLSSSLTKEREAIVNVHKLNSVIEQLGGLANDSFKVHIDTSKINLIDGKVDDNSVRLEVDRIRQQFPMILKPSGAKMPSQAPGIMGPATVDFTKMSLQDAGKAMAELLMNKK